MFHEVSSSKDIVVAWPHSYIHDPRTHDPVTHLLDLVCSFHGEETHLGGLAPLMGSTKLCLEITKIYM